MQALPPSRVPKYRLHKTSGRAVVRLEGRDIYLGKHGSDESKQRYHRIISEWLASKDTGSLDYHTQKTHDLTINELILAYLDHARTYYVKNGKPTREAENVKDSLREFCQLYGDTRVDEFGPIRLKTVRESMIARDLCRNVINARINRLRRVFKWAVENQLTPASVLETLKAVAPLKPGRSSARESEPVKPVPEEQIQAVLGVAPPQVSAMIQLQLLTGMRPGEVVLMKGESIERSDNIWSYKPNTHKTEHRDKTRVIFLGPKAQRVLSPFLLCDPCEYLFNPQDVVNRSRRRSCLTSKSSISFVKLSKDHQYNYRRAPGKRYTTGSYARAIGYACAKTFPPPLALQAKDLDDHQKSQLEKWRKKYRWSPNQLRHNAGTNLRKEGGIDIARIILGHSSPRTTEIYAEIDHKKAIEVMSIIG